MRHLTLIGALALSLAGCATLTPTQIAENADTTALSTYATIGKLIDAYEGPKCGAQYCDPTAEKLRSQAWNILATSRGAGLSQLQAILTTVKGL